jgi:hypothetical protein
MVEYGQTANHLASKDMYDNTNMENHCYLAKLTVLIQISRLSQCLVLGRVGSNC